MGPDAEVRRRTRQTPWTLCCCLRRLVSFGDTEAGAATMSTTQTLITVLKAELKTAGLTYAALARELGLAESSVKRMFAKGEMTLSRLDEICRVLRTDYAELSRQVADASPQRHELTVEQEAAVVADPKLMLVASCALSLWTMEQMVATYKLTEAEAVLYLTRLDKLGIIELKAGNRYRLHLAKTFRWRADGPVMQYFRTKVVGDYFEGGFDGEGELFMLVHGQIGRSLAAMFNERLERVAQDFAHQHQADQKLPPDQKRPYTLVISMRSWLFGAFRDLKREPDVPVAGPRPLPGVRQVRMGR
jgi:transcriptional regulator with XRE-family HTH domain